MPIPPQMLTPLITGGINVAAQLATKPKEKVAGMDYLNRYISNLRSDLGKRETFHTMMRSNLKNIGTSTARARREAGYLAELKGGGGGVLSQEMQRIQQEQNQAIQQATEQATLAQQRQTSSIQARLQEAEMMRERILQQTREANQQWQQGLIQTGLQTIGQVGAGALQYGQQQAEQQKEDTQQAFLDAQSARTAELQSRIGEDGLTSQNVLDQLKEKNINPNQAMELIQNIQKYQPPEEPTIKRGEVKTAYDTKGNQIEYQMVDGVATNMETGQPVDFNRYNLKPPPTTETKFGTLKEAFDAQGNSIVFRDVDGVPTEIVTGQPVDFTQYTLTKPKTEKTQVETILETTGSITVEMANSLPDLIAQKEKVVEEFKIYPSLDPEEKDLMFRQEKELQGLKNKLEIDKVTPRLGETEQQFVDRLVIQGKDNEAIIRLFASGFKKDQTRPQILFYIDKARKKNQNNTGGVY